MNPRNLRIAALAVTLLAAACASAAIWAKPALGRRAESGVPALDAAAPVRIPGSGELEVAFSPNGGGTELVIKTIRSAKPGGSIRVLAYSFTSAPIAQALLDVYRRGVDVKVVVDKSQKGVKYSSAAFIANMGIPIRVDMSHAIAHDKVVIVDGITVEQGSFNYTKAAEEKNGENVLVHWNNARLAELYLRNWQRHWDHSEPLPARY